jgi:predicted ABC-type transport system involved in lysophospholipase L1 biosynthesis ATPase subunit
MRLCRIEATNLTKIYNRHASGPQNLLNELGVGDRLDHGTAMLLGEQQQRVAAVVLAA